MPFVPLANPQAVTAQRRGFVPLTENPPESPFNKGGSAAAVRGFIASQPPASNPPAGDRSATLPASGIADPARAGAAPLLARDSNAPLGTLANPSVAKAAPRPGYLARLFAGYRSTENLSQDLMDTVSDRAVPEIDPATGRTLTTDEQRARRLRYEQRTRDKLAIPPAQNLTEASADVLGALAKEAADPLAIVTGAYGAAARGFNRLRKLAAMGGLYEGTASTLEQLSDEGAINRPGEIAGRAAIGATAAPALDIGLRAIGAGIRKGLALRKHPDADAAAIDAQIHAGITAAQELARDAGVDERQALSTLTEHVNTPDGVIVRPRGEALDALPGETNAPSPQPSPVKGEGAAPPRGFVPLARSEGSVAVPGEASSRVQAPASPTLASRSPGQSSALPDPAHPQEATPHDRQTFELPTEQPREPATDAGASDPGGTGGEAAPQVAPHPPLDRSAELRQLEAFVGHANRAGHPRLALRLRAAANALRVELDQGEKLKLTPKARAAKARSSI